MNFKRKDNLLLVKLRGGREEQAHKDKKKYTRKKKHKGIEDENY